MDRRDDLADGSRSYLRLTGGFAHGIRNPLNTLSLSLQFLERLVSREPDPERRASLERYVRAAEAEAERIDKMVAAFVEAARPAEPQLESVDVRAVVESAVAEARAECEVASGAAAVREGAPVEARADPRALRAAIAALVRNAIEARGDAAVQVEVTSEPAGGARVLVRDRGAGFSEAALARVPELFFTTKPGRLGTGLVLAERVAAAHGGRIEVRNREGGGAEVSIRWSGTLERGRTE